jgi:DNA polymerase I-like protein with 3'-5' exonuclease and polymerase domains
MKPAKCLTCPRYRGNLIQPLGANVGAKVVFLLEAPPSWARVSLSGREADLLKTVLSRAASQDATGATRDMINSALYMYSAACASPLPVTVKQITQCSENVGAQQLLNSGATVVVVFGAKPLSFFGLKDKHSSLLGGVKDIRFHNKDIQLVTTFSVAQLLREPGLADVMAVDIQKAAKLVVGKPLDGLDVPSLLKGYDIPKSLEEAIAIAEEYCAYTKPGKPVNQTMMALDFETNTLFNYWDKSRAIALSGSVAPGKAFALFIDHKDSPYAFEDIAPWIWKILQSGHPKCWWNYKFDLGIASITLVRQTNQAMRRDPTLLKRIEEVTGEVWVDIQLNPVNNTQWDGLLGEHMLDENKSGHYSLKRVLLKHFPSLSGYEKPLHEQIAGANASRAQDMLDSALCNEDPLAYDSPINFRGSISDELEKIKSTSSALRAKKRAKGAPAALKDTIDNTVDILSRRAKHVKKVRTEVQKILRTITSIDEGIEFNNPLHNAATFEDVSVDVMMPYAAIDADLTLRISEHQRKTAWREDLPKVAKSEGRQHMMTLMSKHYLPLTAVLTDMQTEGIRIDRDYLLNESHRLAAREIELEVQLVTKIAADLGRDPQDIVLNNPTELANLMVGGYGLPVVATTDKGEASSNNESMEAWSRMNPIAGKILEYRQVCKARSTYVNNLLTLSDYDSRVHGNIWANGTATGRLSASKPNLQNQPPSLAGCFIKKAFVPTDTSSDRLPWDNYLMHKYGWKEGTELCVVDLDFAGAEVRGLTVYAQDPGLLDALNKGLDMHSWVSSIVFDLDYDEINTARKVDKAQQNEREKYLVLKRQHAKAIVFGLIFCISAPKLANDLKIPVQEAEGLMSLFFKRFPKIQEYIESTKRRVVSQGILRTPTGRARRFPLARAGGSIAAASQRQGVNFLVQGFTSEIVNRVLINLHKHMPEISGRLMITVHDSIVFEMPRNNLHRLEDFFASRVREFIKEEFPMVPVELPYDVEVGPTYGEAKHSIESYAKNTVSVV